MPVASSAVRTDRGFTLVEVLVTVSILAIVGVTFLSLMVSSTNTAQDTENIIRVSEEARLGFTRMVRDTREAGEVLEAPATYTVPATEYKVAIDFDADSTIAPEGTKNAAGDYEVLRFHFVDGDGDGVGTVRINNEILMRDITCVKNSGACRPLFDFNSNHLEYDWNGDGVATWRELDEAPIHSVIGVGNNNQTLDGAELPLISDVVLRMRVVAENTDASSNFYSEAQLRNVR
jgi:prepilin-type N-terminal cleavage/methylation domain-containing protein